MKKSQVEGFEARWSSVETLLHTQDWEKREEIQNTVVLLTRLVTVIVVAENPTGKGTVGRSRIWVVNHRIEEYQG